MKCFIKKIKEKIGKRSNFLIKDDKAAIAVITAVFLTSFIAFTGAAVDLAIVYSARNQLQNAADASARAGASTLVVANTEGEAQANYSGAMQESIDFTEANKLLTANLDWLVEQDLFEAGLWDMNSEDFSSKGPTANPNDLTAARVTLARPVKTYFAPIVGINQVNVQAKATAFLGWAGSAPGGAVDLPIAIQDTAIGECGNEIRFNSEQTENAAWTAFFIPNANKPNIQQYITGEEPCPALKVDDEISLNNGVIASLFSSLETRFNSEKGPDGTWRVLLPVVSEQGPTLGTVKGFMHFVITEVNGAPDKELVGHMECQTMIVPGSTTGGENYGTRASRAVLMH